MADVAYNTSSFPALLRTLASLLALPVSDAQSHRDELDDDVANDPGDDPGPRERNEKADDRDYERGCGGRESDHALVLLAYKERDPRERRLWHMMTRKAGVVHECVGRQGETDGLPIEIWLEPENLKIVNWASLQNNEEEDDDV